MGDLFSDLTCTICHRPINDYGCTMPGEDVGAFCRAPRKVVFDIPEGTKPQRCRSCPAEVFFVQHAKTSKWMPLNADGTSHFSNCPNADTHRRTR